MRLSGLCAVVTGSASGLGRATARRFAEEGARVACVDLADGAHETAARIVEGGGQAIGVQADVSLPEDAQAMARRVTEELGDVDVVFAGAGVAGAGDAASTSMEQWHRVLSVNLTGKWLSFRYFLPRMAERGAGSVIVVASVGAVVGVPGIFPYAAAKGGCIAMARQAAIEYAPKGIRVNSIAPGTIPTPLVRESYSEGGGATAGDRDVDAALLRAAARYPLGRLGEPDHVAALAVHLASPESSWTTGQNLVVDGGLSAS